MRLDYDPIKGPHINITDFRKERGPGGSVFYIPFTGNELTVKSLLNHLNTKASLESAKNIFYTMGDIKNTKCITHTLENIAGGT